MTGFVAGIARQTVEHNVTINNILPGRFDTDRLRSGLAFQAQKSGRPVEELEAQSRAVLEGSEPGPAEVYPHRIAFNVLPQVETFKDGDDYTTEERKVMRETRKILGSKTSTFKQRFDVKGGSVQTPWFSGGSSGISVGHISPEAAAGGVIGLIEDGDRVVIAVASRALTLDVADDVLAERRAKVEAAERPWQPRDRDRPVSKALRAYAALATSAHTGAVRRVP